MRTRLLLALALAALQAAGLRAADLSAPLAAGEPDLATLQRLQTLLPGAAPAGPLSQRGDLVLALAAVGQQALAPSAPPALSSSDYDALYALLQKYRDELREMGFSQKQLEDELAALKVRAAELKDRLDKLQPRDGLKLDGQVSTLFDNVSLTGPGQGNGKALLYRHGLLRTELQMNGTRGVVSGNAEFFFQRVLGDMYSCTTCISSLVVLNMELRTPVALQVGDLDVKTSPLTLWRNEDEQPFEAEPFAGRRADLVKQLRLEPDALRLRGARISTDWVWFEKYPLELQAMIFNLGLPGQLVYQRGTYQTLGADAPGGGKFTSAFTTYFGAWQASLPLRQARLNYQGTQVRDSTDTGTKQIRGFDNVVHSFGVNWRPKGVTLSVDLEWGVSEFSAPNIYGKSDYTPGTAAYGRMRYGNNSLQLGVAGYQVANNFVAPGAQGRTQDAEYFMAPFVTDNSLFNPSPTGIGQQYGGIGVPAPPETNFNTQLLPPQMLNGLNKAVRFMIPWDWRVNFISPYGLATPNRRGGQLRADYRFLRDSLTLAAGYHFANELVALDPHLPLSMTVFRAGFRFDLAPWWQRVPLRFSAGYTRSDAGDGATKNPVSFGSNLLDLGMEWPLSPRLVLQAGSRQTAYSGYVPYTGTTVGKYLVQTDQTYTQGGLGLKWTINDEAFIRANYTSLLFDDNLKRKAGLSPQYQYDQGFVQFGFVF